MKIVIDLPEDIYKKYMDDYTKTVDILHAVRHGTPLPKGHGRMIDADGLEKDMIDALKNSLSIYEAKVFVEFMNYVDDAPTIIEGSESE